MSEQQAETLTPETQKTTMSPKEAIAYLAEKFPLCFSVEGEAKPLKIGLFQDLAEALADDEKMSKTQIRHALRNYTMGWRYLHACVAGAVRVDLNGNEAGMVEAEQAEHAAKTLEEAKAAYSERREQQRKEQRKAFFKQKAREENVKKRAEQKEKKAVNKTAVPKASAESLAALESLFGKGRK